VFEKLNRCQPDILKSLQKNIYFTPVLAHTNEVTSQMPRDEIATLEAVSGYGWSICTIKVL